MILIIASFTVGILIVQVLSLSKELQVLREHQTNAFKLISKLGNTITELKKTIK